MNFTLRIIEIYAYNANFESMKAVVPATDEKAAETAAAPAAWPLPVEATAAAPAPATATAPAVWLKHTAVRTPSSQPGETKKTSSCAS